MLKPDTVLVQEIKVVPAKAKIMDMVAIRHPSSNADHRTTLILLCEDGSLRIYMAAMEQTGFSKFDVYSLKCVVNFVNLHVRQKMEENIILYFTRIS